MIPKSQMNSREYVEQKLMAFLVLHAETELTVTDIALATSIGRQTVARCLKWLVKVKSASSQEVMRPYPTGKKHCLAFKLTLKGLATYGTHSTIALQGIPENS